VFPARPGEGDVLIREGMDLALIRPDSTRRREFPKPGSAGIASTLLDVDGDGAMEVLAGTGPDSLLYVYDAGESTAVARGLAWPTVRGDAMRTGSRDVSPPALIRDLRVTAVTDTFVRLEWTVPSNQGADFQPMRFEVQVATDSLIENGNDPTFAIGGPSLAAGMPEFVEFRQTDTDVLHWFAMWAVDSMGNRSRISNVVSGVKRDSVPGGGPIALAPRINPSGVPVPFLWRAAPGTSGGRLELFDVVGRRVRRFDLVGTGGGLNWDGRDSHGMRVPAALYFARLSCGSLHTQTRVVLLP
jgi:hypothetical protein